MSHLVLHRHEFWNEEAITILQVFQKVYSEAENGLHVEEAVVYSVLVGVGILWTTFGREKGDLDEQLFDKFAVLVVELLSFVVSQSFEVHQDVGSTLLENVTLRFLFYHFLFELAVVFHSLYSVQEE